VFDIAEITQLDILIWNETLLAIRWPSSGFVGYDDITIFQDLFQAISGHIF
jgi:hypothetical protein